MVFKSIGLIKQMRLKKVLLPLAFLASLFLQSCQSPEKASTPKSLEKRLENPSRNYREDKHAFLICGSNEERFAYDLSAIYQTLLRRGFKDKDIIILDEQGVEKFLYCSDGRATEENVKKVFDYLSKKVDPLDTLVVHLDDHGLYFEHPTRFGMYVHHSISLSDTSLTKRELGDYLSKIKPRLGIVTVDTCYAEGMLEHLPEGYIGIAGTKENSLGYSGKRDSFGGHFYLSWCDGENITIEQAFNTARERHSFSIKERVKPQIKARQGLEKSKVP